jgi:hypothetical protein
VFVGVDIAKGDLYAQATTTGGEELFDRPVANDEAAVIKLIADAAGHGTVALVVDQPASGAQLLLAAARSAGVPVASVTGLQMRRAADLYAGAATTDPRDTWVLADFARRNADRLAWLSVTDELLTGLRVFNGRDVDLATDANRITNRCVMPRSRCLRALERAMGDRLGHAGVRDGAQGCHVRDIGSRGSTTGLRFQGCMVIPAGPGGGVEKGSGGGPGWGLVPSA